MKTKLVVVAAFAAAVLVNGGIAVADPAPPAPSPDPNAPKCWTQTDDGWMHTALLPCGWTYSSSQGWQQLPPPPP
ncbi:hypothetical protein [Candidatus Mycobacterium methanotrophicum]|uniref:Secreted protein n=1 Tax=Candidatus Mycobacterium methanotrophicum TaxID=2943498 RepID=A0ABY4QHI9_9MYCO|nr:hypothetical protein [Candidatus Mycobacterium methanotrophicum]UQX10482.1 hypothetical protein M5I08_20775 [Candidatus Mycobacterium methanotrophicum]